MKRWFIRLDGFPGHYRLAETKAKARWADYCSAKEAGYFSSRDGFRRYLANLACIREDFG